MGTQSRERYMQLLTRGVDIFEFQNDIERILDTDPYFTPGYVELLLLLDKDNDVEAYENLFTKAMRHLTPILTNRQTRERVTHSWTDLEALAFCELLEMRRYKKSALVARFMTRLQQRVADDIAANVPHLEVTTGIYLRKLKTFDPKPAQEEVRAIEDSHWQTGAKKLKNRSFHKSTLSVYLREKPERTVAYTPIDGAHESRPTEISAQVPTVMRLLDTFAHDEQIALGGALLAQLAPHAHAYRHYDDVVHTYLKGRRRYHMVIEAGTHSMLSVGTETVCPQPGEIWFFDHRVMHRAFNDSDTPRTHVIFDGYPLDSA